MHTVNIHEAKTHFSKLVDFAMQGEEIIIAKSGKPVARLCPIKEKRKRQFGLLKGKIKIPKDFDAPLPLEVLEEFER